ncbi:MAG: YeeE/YedE family protein [Alphaproteobacteria bacterium]
MMIDWGAFTPEAALAGGALIGAAAVLLYWFNGRIAGVSGIASGLLRPTAGESAWRACFLVGLVIGAILAKAFGVAPPALDVTGDVVALLAGGLLVGFGTRVGGGCTSGHGVCGLARLSRRSLVATLVFMAAAFATVYLVRHGVGAG